MKNARRVPLIVGIVLALGTAVLLVSYLTTLRSSAQTADMRTVYVASHDVPARALITDAFVASSVRPAAQVDPDAVVDRKEIVGKYSLITIPAGSVVTKSKIGPGGAFALPARLPIGMRAVSISIDKVKGVAGLIQPGDRVDVIAVPPRVANETPRAAAILRGALVLAMGNEVETTTATPSPDNQNLTTVTLALTPSQVNLLAAADLNTTLRLALRPPKEAIRAFPAEPLALGTVKQPVQTVPTAVAPPATVPVALTGTAPVVAAAVHPIVKHAGTAVTVIDLGRQ
ncbi:MAG TPA: Flp pilus assembly protein CpaB [Candidatus Elarobacter sp.]|jgi:pilus assembly protein CpaB